MTITITVEDITDKEADDLVVDLLMHLSETTDVLVSNYTISQD